MSKRFGTTYSCKIGMKAFNRKFSQGSLMKTTDTENDEWESEVDKVQQNRSPPQWTRKRSYITRLQKQNKRRFLKTPSNSKCNKKNSAPDRTFARSELKQDKEDMKEDTLPFNREFTSKNSYCVWTKGNKYRVEVPSTSKMFELSKVSLEKKSSADWKQVRRKHIVNKFDRFSKGVLKLTGKLSSETVNMITTKIRENLERKEEGYEKRWTKEYSKKKTVSFIKKILKGTSVKLPAHHRKKPQKKYNLVKQSFGPNSKTRSSILPKLLNLKMGGVKSFNKNKNMHTSTKTLYRSQSELMVKSSFNIKLIRSFSETSTIALPKTVEYSTSDLSKESTCKLDNGSKYELREPIKTAMGNFKDASSKKIINITKKKGFTDSYQGDDSENSSSSSVPSAKLINTLDSNDKT